MKKILAAMAIVALTTIPSYADDSQLMLGVSGFVNGVAIGGTYVHTHRHHKKKKHYYAEEQVDYGADPGYYPPAEGGCTFKSKMQGRVKCGPGMPPPQQQQGYDPQIIDQDTPQQAEAGLIPHLVPTQCEPFYYREFVPGYGWQILRNYRC